MSISKDHDRAHLRSRESARRTWSWGRVCILRNAPGTSLMDVTGPTERLWMP
jgi:hypothetical protein